MELPDYGPPSVRQHVALGVDWLEKSQRGENAYALSHAALELRFALESLVTQYWATLHGGRIPEEQASFLRTFKSIQNKIYELAGHQRQIDRHFAFMRTFLSEMKIDHPLVTPNLGRLAGHWHTCSECCHVGWLLQCSRRDSRLGVYEGLSAVVSDLQAQVASLGWPHLNDPDFMNLRDRYVQGEATDSDLRQYMRRVGMWVRAEYNDGRPSHFVGTPVAPESDDAQ